MDKILKKGKVAVGFIDHAWGSGGKGKWNGLVSVNEEPDFAVSHNSVQASHVFVGVDGFSYKFQHLPTSVVCPKTRVLIGAGASINVGQLMKEIDDWCLDEQRLGIHPNAVVISKEDVEFEREFLLRIASTMTGNGAALGRKVMRHPGVKTVSDIHELKPFICDVGGEIRERCHNGEKGIIETAQGFDLSIDHSMILNGGKHKGYPYVTSRNVDPMTFVGMTGIPKRLVGSVLLNVRTLPIRVGDSSNTEKDGFSGVSLDGSNSGFFYPDQVELTWDQVNRRSGNTSESKFIEMTSLTKRLRRIFSFSKMQYEYACSVIDPDFISVNFIQYIDASLIGVSGDYNLREFCAEFEKVGRFIVEMLRLYKPSYSYLFLGTGAGINDFITLHIR